MHGISDQTKKKLSSGAFCEVKADSHSQRLTVSHPLRFAGRQVKEDWAEVIACDYHHAVGIYQDRGDYNEEVHQLIALNKATEEQLRKYSKALDLVELRDTLRKKYEGK